MRLRLEARRASGLVIVLAVLAMLAIMATTFISLMRLDLRITSNYVDDTRCELLARGMLNYFGSILRDDSDRSWGPDPSRPTRYVNRQTSVGYYGYNDAGVTWMVPGTGESSWGTSSARSFWYYAPAPSWGDYSAIFGDVGNYGPWWQTQGTLAYNNMVIGRFWDPIHHEEVDAWLHRNLISRDNARGFIVSNTSTVPKTPIADSSAADYNTYYDYAPFITSTAGGSKYFTGQTMTGEKTLPGGIYWRWAAKMGIPTTTYVDLNVAGNLDGADTNYLLNMGEIGLGARRVLDETADQAPYAGLKYMNKRGSDHLGRIEWKGFPGEVMYAAGFPMNYDAVFWHPSQSSMEKIFFTPTYSGAQPQSSPDWVMVDRKQARALISYRWPDGSPNNHDPRYRVGWRRDGASYYKLPTPENPQGHDRYFGINEVIEHDRSVYHPAGSAIAAVLKANEASPGQGKWDERGIRPYFTSWSTDTILRGKIWPLEGPLPWRNAQAGDFKHIDILKRVNLNIIGASNPDDANYPHLPNEDLPLLRKWYAKRDHERARLYFMLRAALKFTQTLNPEQQACQFIASLADMIDVDHDETFYAAPDENVAVALANGHWGLGVEKNPVLNSVVFFSGNNKASTANWECTALRIELYNPMANIPWIPDAAEAFDVSEYRIRIATRTNPTTHVYRVGDLVHYQRSDQNPNSLVGTGAVTTIGADGMYGDPNINQTWSRFLHIGWPLAAQNVSFPGDITKAEMQAPITVTLWKPLKGDANANLPLQAGRVEQVVTGSLQKYLCVDTTGSIALVGGFVPWPGPGGTYLPTYLGIYRRFDPMNGKSWSFPSFTTTWQPQSSVLWLQGVDMFSCKLGMPNYNYGGLPQGYCRSFEKKFNVVDGDLPSVGWLGELIMWNIAKSGPLTWIHDAAQSPDTPMIDNNGKWGVPWPFPNQLDLKAKLDLFRPFKPLVNGPHYNPWGDEVDPSNLHILDIFTVWDPSNDGIDNDGDGAVDDDDTGIQPGDKGGPEIRVFGKLDLNHIGNRVWGAFMPNNNIFGTGGLAFMAILGREGQRYIDPSINYNGGDYCLQGPYETIGDCLRYDRYHGSPGRQWSVLQSWPTFSLAATGGGYACLGEWGLTQFNKDAWNGTNAPGDDDGDGIWDERNERDMLWTWAANHITTRANVFQLDLNVEVCQPPYYPGSKVPFQAYKTRQSYARKQALSTLDRSTILRIFPDGSCDFSGPVQVKLLRFSDDLRID